jgi:hypothetical protein
MLTGPRPTRRRKITGAAALDCNATNGVRRDEKTRPES